MKKLVGLLALCMFVGALAFSGCGGGGGGGGSNGTDGTTTTDGTTGTDGSTGVDPNSEIWGRVVRSGSAIGIANVVVRFYDINSNEVGTATTRANGYFDADLPASAVRLHVDPSSISNAFHRLYRYDGEWYSAIEPTCKAPLPTIVPGQLKQIPGSTMAIPLSSATPPFPTGCVNP